MQRLLNLLRPVCSVAGADRACQVAALHQGYDEIGGLAVIRHRQIEMVHMGTDVGDDRRDVRTAIRRPATDYEDPDRLVEFTDALAAAVELKLGMEPGLEEPSLISLSLKLVRSDA